MVMSGSEEKEDWERLILAVEADEKTEFVSLVNKVLRVSTVDYVFATTLWHNAVKCATAMLEGETGHSLSQLDRHQSPLCTAAIWSSPSIIKLLLLYYPGDGTMQPLSNSIGRIDIKEAWTPKKSLLELLIQLCLPSTKCALDTTRLLIKDSEGVEELIYCFAKRGKLKKLAALLLVIKGRKNSSLESGNALSECILSVRQLILVEFGFLTFEDSRLMCRYDGSLTSKELRLMHHRYKRRKRRLMITWLLIDVFEKAGDAFDEYLQGNQAYLERGRETFEEYRISGYFNDKDYEVIKAKVKEEVIAVLEDAGFKLNVDDSNMVETYRVAEDLSKTSKQGLEFMLKEATKDVVVKENNEGCNYTPDFCMSNDSLAKQFFGKKQQASRPDESESRSQQPAAPTLLNGIRSFHTVRTSKANSSCGGDLATSNAQVKKKIRELASAARPNEAVAFPSCKNWAASFTILAMRMRAFKSLRFF